MGKLTQARLNDLKDLLDDKQRNDLIARLERPGRGRISAVWETVFLHALSRVAEIKHEAPLANGNKPDFLFKVLDKDIEFEVVGDITSVSDKGLDEQNPISYFTSQIIRIARKHDLEPNYFQYDVRGKLVGEYKDSKMVLTLPDRNKLDELIRKKVHPFIKDIAKKSPATSTMSCSEAEAEFTISYDRSQRFFGGSSVSYDVPYSLKKNPIYLALKDKAKQLRNAAEDSIRLVILCDGDCNAMRKSMLRGNGSFTASEIVTDFLRQSNSIDIVLMVTVEQVRQNDLHNRDLRLGCDFIVPPDGAKTARFSEARMNLLVEILKKSLQVLPIPKIDAANAVLRCEQHGYGLGFHGGSKMGRKVKISSREVHELLSGVISFDKFEKSLGFSEDALHRSVPNPFALRLKRGEMLESIEVIDGGDGDDDWLEFSFRETDPAISPFK